MEVPALAGAGTNLVVNLHAVQYSWWKLVSTDWKQGSAYSYFYSLI
jgi:hypothetical protein